MLCYIEVNLIEDIEREQNIHSFNINTGKVPGEAVGMCPFHFLLSGKNVSKGGGSKQKWWLIQCAASYLFLSS